MGENGGGLRAPVGAEGVAQMGKQVAPWLLHGGGAPDEGDGGQMREAGGGGVVSAQEFAAPQRAVGAEAEAVEQQAKVGLARRDGVIGKAGGHVGVVVGDADELRAGFGGERFAQLGGEVGGVGVDRDELGGEGEEFAVKREDSAIIIERGGVFQIADMGREDGLAAPDQRKGGFEFAAHG